VQGAESGAGERVTYVGIARDPIVVPWEANGVYDVVVSGAGVFEHVVDVPDAVDVGDAPLTGAVVVCAGDWTVVVLV